MATPASSIFNTGGIYNGVRGIIKPSGKYFIPNHMSVQSTADTLSTTAARYYIAPFYVDRLTTFAGAWCYNGGAGDNGDKVKIAFYNESATGGPGTLANSFGEVTLTGAAALRNFASSWSAAPGWYYGELVTDNAVTMYCMTTYGNVSSAGLAAPNFAAGMFGMIGGPGLGGSWVSNVPVGDYVGGTYANFPEASSLAPTNTVFVGNSFPLFGLYV